MKTKLTTVEVFALVASGKITPEQGAEILYGPTELREVLKDTLIWELCFLVNSAILFIDHGDRWSGICIIIVSVAIVNTYRRFRKSR